MIFRLLLATIFFILFTLYEYKDNYSANLQKNTIEAGFTSDNDPLRILFYNVENLFDTLDHPTKNDDEFTPEGNKQWSGWKLRRKTKNLSKVIFASGNPSPPAIIGFCEVENRNVLEDLFYKTPLIKYNYHIVHEESPDARGIDVAFAYQRTHFAYIIHKRIQVTLSDNYPTRDILYVSGKVNPNDTLHIFINHWPSRRGGQQFSEKKRITASETLIRSISALRDSVAKPNIICMGDFNDTPENKSVRFLCKEAGLTNLAFSLPKGSGSHYYKNVFEEWSILDQMMISNELYRSRMEQVSMQIFNPDWIKNSDGTPFRSFKGPIFTAGYSDHFPVYVDLNLGKN